MKRIITGSIYCASIIYSLFNENNIIFLCIFGFFLIVSSYELLNISNLFKEKKIISLFIILSNIIIFNLIYQCFNYKIIIISFGVIFFIIVNFAQFSNVDFKKFISIFFLNNFVILIPFCLLILLKINPLENTEIGNKIMLLIFLGIWVNDTFAFIFGKLKGKKKIFPKISPKKTLEGYMGGIIFSMLFVYFFGNYLFPNSKYNFILIGFIITIAGNLGDLFFSKIKREFNVKDYSSFLPGHGGILDRLDSVLFVTPVIFVYFL